MRISDWSSDVCSSDLVDAAAATLPADIQDRITRKRKAGDADAAIDPLSLPEVKAAVQRASFELLVGFQLTQDQLEYNVRRSARRCGRAGRPCGAKATPGFSRCPSCDRARVHAFDRR